MVVVLLMIVVYPGMVWTKLRHAPVTPAAASDGTFLI